MTDVDEGVSSDVDYGVEWCALYIGRVQGYIGVFHDPGRFAWNLLVPLI